MENSETLEIARFFLGRDVEIVIDRPFGSKHPVHGFVYKVNYGYADGVKAPDGDNLDAYYLGCDKPLNKARGKVIAIVHRLDDDDGKLVVVAEGFYPADDEISRAIYFQERWFEHEIMRD
jgi:inorganic pyrophosphatase